MSKPKTRKKRNRVTISVPQDIDLSFRKMAAIYFSFKRGWYGKAVLEAMKLWITQHSQPKEVIPDETKNYLWNIFKEKINFDSDDPADITDSVINYFEDVKYISKINYKIDENNIILKKENSFESYIPYLITCKDNSLFLNCPIETMIDMALSEFTERNYKVTSGNNTLIYAYEKSKPLEKEILYQKTLSAYSNQSL